MHTYMLTHRWRVAAVLTRSNRDLLQTPKLRFLKANKPVGMEDGNPW